MPLKHIPKVLTGDILKVLADMGHGDQILLADANFPAESIAATSVVGKAIHVQSNVLDMLDAVLTLFPLDNFVACPAAIMKRVDSDGDAPIVSAFRVLLDNHHHLDKCTVPVGVERIERLHFYERAKTVFCVVHCVTEQRLYANIILTKGVIDDRGEVAAPAHVARGEPSKKRSKHQ